MDDEPAAAVLSELPTSALQSRSNATTGCHRRLRTCPFSIDSCTGGPCVSVMSETAHLERFAVSATSESETKTVVTAREFDFVVDEPPTLSGTDEGPNPVEYLLGAWAGCLNVVVHTVAEERGVPIDGVTIETEGELDPRKFLGLVDGVRAGYQEIRVTLEVESDADAGELEELAAAVENRCPVGDTIENSTPTTVTVDAA